VTKVGGRIKKALKGTGTGCEKLRSPTHRKNLQNRVDGGESLARALVKVGNSTFERSAGGEVKNMVKWVSKVGKKKKFVDKRMGKSGRKLGGRTEMEKKTTPGTQNGGMGGERYLSIGGGQKAGLKQRI